ncbi:hypothetical protein LguiA_026601 [Lonicera macranthoides]
MGDELNDLDLDELRGLEQKMDDSLAIIRERKEEKCEVDPQYGLGEYKGDYESVVAFANGKTNLYSFRLHPTHSGLTHGSGRFLSHDHDLRLG